MNPLSKDSLMFWGIVLSFVYYIWRKFFQGATLRQIAEKKDFIAFDQHLKRISTSKTKENSLEKSQNAEDIYSRLNCTHPKVREMCVQIAGVNSKIQALVGLQNVRYRQEPGDQDERFEKYLRLLWKRFYSIPFEGKSAEWKDLGFQGLDPMTDFRSGGLLSLMNLAKFMEHPDALEIAHECKDLSQYYLFAVAGINFTADLMNLLRNDGKWLFAVSELEPLELFQILYNESFISFHAFWKKEGATILEFNIIKKKFWKEEMTLQKLMTLPRLYHGSHENPS